MASWKVSPDPETKTEYIPFLESRKFFAVDASGSTAGSIIRREQEFVEHMHSTYAHGEDSISLWGHYADDPSTEFAKIRWSADRGTEPATILQNSACLETIKNSHVWFLLTDGEIANYSVHQLAELADHFGVFNVPIVFLIVGARGTTPDTTDISVGISFYAGSQDTLILFQETGTGALYVIAAKGCFAPLAGSEKSQDLTSWSNTPVFTNESAFFKHCASIDINLQTIESRNFSAKGISLGAEWDNVHDSPTRVDLDLLLQAGLLSDDDLFSLLSEEAFNNLAVASKTRRRIPELRAFVQTHKVELVTPKLEDVSGAAAIISDMNASTVTEAARKEFQERLREAHAKNREHYQEAIANFSNSPVNSSKKQRNQIVNAAMQTLASIEAAGFNAEILSRKSNRARRAEVVSSDSVTAAAENIDLDGISFRGFCMICCNDEAVMSIGLKEIVDMEDNTGDFALNFPLAAGSSTKNVNVVSSQNICYQCAISMPSGLSIYHEGLTAIIPTVAYDGSNKLYINQQLYLALTDGLATGAAGIAQLFMAVLCGILKTKSWAGPDLEGSEVKIGEHDEVAQRRRTFEFMLEQMFVNTWTRENFTEAGKWVAFPKALIWVAEDFAANNMRSFAVTYPVSGFATLLSLGQKANAFSDETVRRLQIAKAVYSIVAKYLAELLAASQSHDLDGHWKQKYLETIYQEFNSKLVPRDFRGPRTLVTDTDSFFARLSVLLQDQQGERFGWATPDDKTTIMRKIQTVLFWLTQRQLQGMASFKVKDFFTWVELNEYLSKAVVQPSLNVPEPELHSLLLSIFGTRNDDDLIDAKATLLHDKMPPFRTPFGASVLRCGIESCDTPFHVGDPESAVSNIDGIRKARTEHFIQVFGYKTRFEKSNGMPENLTKGKPPSSVHTNYHINIARAWAANSRDKKRAILDDEIEREGFVTSVRQRICEQKRGNVFQVNMDDIIRLALPGFFAVLGEALRLEGKSDWDITLYEHNFDKNSMEERIRYELKASGALSN